MTPLGQMISVFFVRDGFGRPHERAHADHVENKGPPAAFMSCLSCLFSTHDMPLIPRYSHVSCLLSCNATDSPHIRSCNVAHAKDHVSSCHVAHASSCFGLMPAHVMLADVMSCHPCRNSSVSCQNTCYLVPKPWLPMPKLMFPHVMPIHAIFHGGSCLVPLAGFCCACGATSCDSWHKFC